MSLKTLKGKLHKKYQKDTNDVGIENGWGFLNLQLKFG